MRRRWKQALAGVLIWALGLTPAFAGKIFTPQIIAETVNPGTLVNCMRYVYPIGMCFWLTCGPFGCVIRTSLMAGHYNPDLVVTGYHRTGETPWVEMAVLYGTGLKAAGQGLVGSLLKLPIDGGNQADRKGQRLQHEDLRFKEADVIGHPATVITDFLTEALPLVCPSETRALMPYLFSTLDALAWRFGLPEMIYPEALVPSMREIGQWPLNSWAAVYPRHGFVMQSEDPKAGAVVAQRAGDVVTRDLQIHVYLYTARTRPSTRMQVWWPGPLYERDRHSGHWQMLVPLKPKLCEVFGQNDTVGLTSWADGKVDDEGDYAWNLWRPYKCCPRAGQRFLRALQWATWPP